MFADQVKYFSQRNTSIAIQTWKFPNRPWVAVHYWHPDQSRKETYAYPKRWPTLDRLTTYIHNYGR